MSQEPGRNQTTEVGANQKTVRLHLNPRARCDSSIQGRGKSRSLPGGLQANWASPGHRLYAILVVADLINDHGAGENEHVILTGRDIHTIGVSKSEPFPRNGGDYAAAALEGVFAIKKVAGGFEVIRPRHIDG